MAKKTLFIQMKDIKPNRLNKRSMDLEEIEVLSESIKDAGLINPLVVYQNQDGSYTLLDGHRRYRALELMGRAGTNQVPCIVVDKPSDEVREQELMANGNIHRSKPEDLKHEIEVANVLWNTMSKTRRDKLTQEYKQKFIDKFCNDEKYQENPSQFLSNRFRPRIDYIRAITGLDYSNKTVTSTLSEILKAKSEKLNPKIEKEIKEKVITSKDIIRYIKSLKGMLMTYQNSENVPATKSQIRNVIDELNLLEAALWQTLKMSKKAIK